MARHYLPRRQRRRIRPRGAVVVEFALVAPVIFLVLFASIEFAHVSMLRHTAANAAYEAARKVAVPGATALEAIAEATSILDTMYAKAATVTVNPAGIDPETKSVTVSVAIPLRENGLVLRWFAPEQVIRCSSTQQTERYRSAVTAP